MPDDRKLEDTNEQEVRLTYLRQKATALIAQIDFPMTDELHAVIRGKPMNAVAASLASVLADVVAELSTTSHGVVENVLVVDEMIQRIARNGFGAKDQEQAAKKAVSH